MSGRKPNTPRSGVLVFRGIHCEKHAGPCRRLRVDWVHEFHANEWPVLSRLPLVAVFTGRKKVFTQVTSRGGKEWDWVEKGQ